MVDRIFAGVFLMVALAYGAIAFTVIEAPFQYDPLGPESWPQILAVLAVCCLLHMLWRPDSLRLGVARHTWFRLVATVAMLAAYAELYEPLGFVLSTILFGTALAAMLGAGGGRAALFGVTAGCAGYVVCVTLLGLNLPSGALIENLLETAQGEGDA
jgi:putative tricarboxylic transport membrane protein